MKTIFIPLFSGIEGKNILRGGIYHELKKLRVFQVIFFVGTETRANYYRREYPEATFEVIKHYHRPFADRLFSRLKFFTLRTKTIDLKRKTRLEREGGYFRFVLSLTLNRLLSNKFCLLCIRILDYYLVNDPIVAPFFKKYKPDLVFLSDLFNDTEISMIREARKHDILSVGYLSTWDRLTSRWGIRILPDKLIVFNDILKSEAVKYSHFPANHIFVSGAVQLDVHIKAKPLPRADFISKLGLSPQDKFIVYGPLGRTFDSTKQSDIEMVGLLNDWTKNINLPSGHLKIIVRFPPNDFVKKDELKIWPNVIYDIPGIRFGTTRGQDWDMNSSELDHLRNLLYHSELVVCYYSSLSIDAAVFDKPVINIDFYPKDEDRHHPYYQSVHYGKVAKTGGIRLVRNRQELFETIECYMDNPSLDREKRAILVKQQGFLGDGKSAERIAREISKILHINGF